MKHEDETTWGIVAIIILLMVLLAGLHELSKGIGARFDRIEKELHP